VPKTSYIYMAVLMQYWFVTVEDVLAAKRCVV